MFGLKLTAGPGIAIDTDVVTGDVRIMAISSIERNLDDRLQRLERLLVFVAQNYPQVITDAERHFAVVDRMSGIR